MNFNEVKSITIPEGNVKSMKINGVEVWKKKSGFDINDYEINEDLVIKTAQFRTTRVCIGKQCTFSISSTNKNIVNDFIIIDNLTQQPVTISKYVINHNNTNIPGDIVTVAWKAELPEGTRYFTVYLLDENGKRSTEGATVSINYTQ